MDEVPMNDKDERESFLFRHTETKVAAKRAPRNATGAPKGKVVARGSTVLVGDTHNSTNARSDATSLPPGQQTIQAAVRTSSVNQQPAVAMETESSPTDSTASDTAVCASTITEPSNVVQSNATAMVIHKDDDVAHRASIWNDLVSKASAMAPPFPNAPELVHFPYDPSKVTMVPCGTSGFMLQFAR